MNITDDGRTQLTYEEAVALLPDGDQIHTYMDSGFALIGADWARYQILDLLADGGPEMAGVEATAMGHGLVAFRRGEPIFISTTPTQGATS